MMTSQNYRVLVRFPMLFALVALVSMGVFSKRGYLDWKRMEQQNSDLSRKIASAVEQQQALNQRIESFQANPYEQERVVRQVLGYVKANETVIEFQ